MTRWSSLSSAVLALACASRGPAFESVTTLPDEPRYPAGVEVERLTTLPDARPSGHTQSGVLVLLAPMDPGQARATVDAFFRAMAEESPSGLDSGTPTSQWGCIDRYATGGSHLCLGRGRHHLLFI
jgi:hypothetical protein